MKLVIINGYPGSGKDEFVIACNYYVSCLNISSVDRVKQAYALLGWKGDKTPEHRANLSLLKDMSTDLFDGPVNYVKSVAKSCEGTCDELVFAHAREPKELERYRAELGATIIFIERQSAKAKQSNHADAEVEDFVYDYYIDNNGDLVDLEEAARRFLMDLFHLGTEPKKRF